MPTVSYGQSGITYGLGAVEYGEPGFASYPDLEYWAVDGASLQTYAYNIATWGGSRQSAPPLRGEDTLIPHRIGKVWNQKMPDSRTITLGMWVIGAAEDGSIPTDGTMRRKFEKNWRMLKRLLWTPNRQIELTKRFYDDTDTLVTASARAQFAGGLEPEMNGKGRAAFTVDLMLADPFFYGRPTSFLLSVNTPLTIAPLGDAETTKSIVTLTGPLTNPLVSFNSDPLNGFMFNGALASGESLVVDVDNFKAMKYTATGASKAVGQIINTGNSYYWLPIGPLSGQLLMTAVSGTGTATISTQAAWL